MIRGIPEGISVFPLIGAGADPKGPHLQLCPRWSVYAQRPPTEGEIELWSQRGSGWWGCPGGGVNGGLVVLDVDVPEKHAAGWVRSAQAPAHHTAWRELVEAHLGADLLASLPVSVTPSGGRHVWWRCPEGPHGTGPRARRMAPGPDGRMRPHVLIETRGTGAYAACPPTPGYTWEHLGWENIPTLDAATGEALLRCAELLDEMPAAEDPAPNAGRPASGGAGAGGAGERLGDWFDRNVDWDDVLLPLGWRRVGQYGGKRTYRHPAATARLSAVVGGDGDRLRCFSGNVAGIEPATGGTRNAYTKFRFVALNQHGGDFSAAARWVRERYPQAPGRAPLRVERGGRADAGRTVAPADGSAALEHAEEPDGGDRPEIVVTGRDPEYIAQEIAGILADGRVYSRGGLPVTIWPRDGRPPEAAPLDGSRLLSAAADALVCIKVSSEGKRSPRALPPDIGSIILGRSAERWGFSPLRGITAAPIPGAREPGYDPGTGWYSSWTGRLDPPAADAAGCYRWLIEEWLADFPFDGPASQANAVALALTLYARPAVDGPCPLWMVEAPTPGTGKTLLAQVVAIPALGVQPSAMAATASEEELEKRVTSLLVAAAPYALLDNLDRRLDSPSLTMALTSVLYRARMMGTHQAPEVPASTVWAATANNATVSRDLARRSVVVRLDARTAEPEKRTDYRHPDIVRWTRENRGRILGALDRILAGWRAAGEPPAPGPRRGSYEAWHGLVGAAVVHAGGVDLMANDEEFRQRADPDEAEWRALVGLWWRERGSQDATSMDVRDLAVAEGLLMGVIGEGPDAKTLPRMGRALGRMLDRVFIVDGQRLSIRRSRILDGRTRYRVVPEAPSGDTPLDFEPKVRVSDTPTPYAGETGENVVGKNIEKGGECLTEPHSPLPMSEPDLAADGWVMGPIDG